jgi:hypothetical protein
MACTFPRKKNRIDETWQKIKGTMPLIQRYRNKLAFHANKDPQVYFKTYYEFRDNRKVIFTAMQEFWQLAAELKNYEQTALPDFRERIEPALRKAFPRVDDVGLEKLKDYFVPR